ncbi:MAG: single-stranded-DNA-specific exonuclease RecJ, partial [Chloroflexi bacterium]|nr:single-stranded-DNA-specific exonuclease RecJ [Chloroflexota bacterium]
GTVADIVPLVGENRHLVSQGLERINELRRPGLQALIERARLSGKPVNASHIGYILGPRLNAAGRIAAASLSYRLLTTPSVEEARRMAGQLEELNQERRIYTQDAFQEALADLQERAAMSRPLLMVANDSFHPGIVGLVASKLTETFYRPSVVVEMGDPYSKGSARSIPEFHITDALDRCADLLVHHGGHAAAAGFTVSREKLPELEERLLALAEEALGQQDLAPSLEVDAEIPIAEASWSTVELIGALQPFGEENPTPRFLSRDVDLRDARPVGRDSRHLRVWLSHGQEVHQGIAFNLAHRATELAAKIDVVYHLEVNEWNGESRVQLNLQDFRPSEGDG